MLRQVKSHSAERIAHSAKELFLCLLSAAFLSLSFLKFNLWILAWFGFLPLFLTIKHKTKPKAFLLSYLTGIIFWAGTIYWLIHVTLPGTIILILYLALYFGIFGLMVSTIDHRPSTIDQLLFIPSLWVLLEFIRSYLFTGFGWALLGYSQYLNLPVIQIADITGVWGVSFLVMMANVMVYSLIAYRLSLIGEQKKYIITFICLAAVLGYGYYKLYRTPMVRLRSPSALSAVEVPNSKHRTLLRVCVIQGNIPQELKWDTASRDFIIDKYLALSIEATRDKPDLIIWPEAALPVVLEEEPEYFEKVKAFSKMHKMALLLGAVTSRGNLYYNSAIFVSADGKSISQYDKLHLVPFGEYIPLRKALSFMETIAPIGDIERGKEFTIFKTPEHFATLICFEDLFPELSRQFVRRGADFLVNITNDAWYKKTSAPEQHLQASVFRALENRVFLVRSANTGISGFISPSGKIISLVQDKKREHIFIDGHETAEIVIPKRRGLTFYSRYGDSFVGICLLFLLCGIIRKKKG